MSGAITEVPFRVPYHDTDLDLKLSPVVLLDYFLDASIEQSDNVGVGLNYFAANHVTWMLHKWSIRIDRLPGLYENVISRTQPFSMYKFYAYRKFWLIGAGDEVLASAESEWLFIDTDKRRPIRAPAYLHEKYGVPGEFEDKLDIPDVEPPAGCQFEKQIVVRKRDTDTNDHVNSASYLEWALDTLPDETFAGKRLARIDLLFERETHFGKTVRVCGEKAGDAANFAVYDNEDQRLAMLKMLFE